MFGMRTAAKKKGTSVPAKMAVGSGGRGARVLDAPARFFENSLVAKHPARAFFWVRPPSLRPFFPYERAGKGQKTHR